jgi:hypothetical protein
MWEFGLCSKIAFFDVVKAEYKINLTSISRLYFFKPSDFHLQTRLVLSVSFSNACRPRCEITSCPGRRVARNGSLNVTVDHTLPGMSSQPVLFHYGLKLSHISLLLFRFFFSLSSYSFSSSSSSFALPFLLSSFQPLPPCTTTAAPATSVKTDNIRADININTRIITPATSSTSEWTHGRLRRGPASQDSSLEDDIHDISASPVGEGV